MSLSGNYKKRESGIELLKIIAILLIVLNHVIQSLTETNAFLPVSDYIINITSNTTDIQTILLAILRTSGNVGNDIFVICSAWFLIDAKRNDKRKILFLIIDVWVISVIIFAVTYLLGCDLNRDDTLAQFFPTSNGNCWFVTCYIMLLLIYPFLNKLIEILDKKKLLAAAAGLFLIYSIITYFKPWFVSSTPFYMTDLVVWIMMYFMLAYIKLYMPDFQNNTKANVIGLLIGIFGQACMTLISDLSGLAIEMFAGRVLYFNYAGSPFILLLVICAFNLARKIHFRSAFINYVSGLSLLIYLLHENWIVRNVYRPWIFYYIKNTFGYSHILLWVFAAAAAIFIAAAILSIAYKHTIEKLVHIVSDKLYALLSKLWSWFFEKLLKLH